MIAAEQCSRCIFDDGGNGAVSTSSFDDYSDSGDCHDNEGIILDEDVVCYSKEFEYSSPSSLTPELDVPMRLPTFKPAIGCTDASDFVIRCFLARLRAGITVIKYGCSRWSRPHRRELIILPDKRTLTWKPAEGEPTTRRKEPKLDLSNCREVRHAWSTDPNCPMYTGTRILRRKCESSNAHKSFSLIFRDTTVDITALTADQCKVLMAGFSAVCYRLQAGGQCETQASPDGESLGATESLTVTNS